MDYHPSEGTLHQRRNSRMNWSYFFPNISKTSNKTTIVDHSGSDQESINEECIDQDVCDNTTEEKI